MQSVRAKQREQEENDGTGARGRLCWRRRACVRLLPLLPRPKTCRCRRRVRKPGQWRHAAAPVAPAPAAAATAPKGFFPFSFSPGKGAGPSQATAFDANQRALLDKVSGYLSSVQTLVGNFVQIGPDGRRVEGTFSHSKAGQGPLPVQSAEPDRHHRRRLLGRGARSFARNRRTFIRCRKRRCAICWPTALICCATPMSSACRLTTRSSPW